MLCVVHQTIPVVTMPCTTTPLTKCAVSKEVPCTYQNNVLLVEESVLGTTPLHHELVQGPGLWGNNRSEWIILHRLSFVSILTDCSLTQCRSLYTTGIIICISLYIRTYMDYTRIQLDLWTEENGRLVGSSHHLNFTWLQQSVPCIGYMQDVDQLL